MKFVRDFNEFRVPVGLSTLANQLRLVHVLFAEMTMGQRVTGHGSSGSTNLSGSRGSRVSSRDPLTHDQVNKIPRTGYFVTVTMFDFESTSTQWS